VLRSESRSQREMALLNGVTSRFSPLRSASNDVTCCQISLDIVLHTLCIRGTKIMCDSMIDDRIGKVYRRNA